MSKYIVNISNTLPFFTIGKAYKLCCHLIWELMWIQLQKWCLLIESDLRYTKKTFAMTPSGEVQNLAILPRKLLEIWEKLNNKAVQHRRFCIENDIRCAKIVYIESQNCKAKSVQPVSILILNTIQRRIVCEKTDNCN